MGALNTAWAATPDFLEFRDPDGWFAVSLPAAPVAKAADENVQISDENEQRYSVQVDDNTCLIHVSEVPAFAVWLAPLALLYDRAKVHYLEKSNFTEPPFNEIHRSDRTGRALDFAKVPKARAKDGASFSCSTITWWSSSRGSRARDSETT